MPAEPVAADGAADGARTRSWWSTLPGMLTALATTITAISGLVVALFQAGLLGPKDRGIVQDVRDTLNPVSVATAAPSAAPIVHNALIIDSSKVVTPTSDPQLAANGVSVLAFPSHGTFPMTVSSMVQTSDPVDVTYRILSATIGPGKRSLRLHMRMTNMSRSSVYFSDDDVRLLADNVPLAPTAYPTESISRDSAKEGDFTFDVPAGSAKLVLKIGKTTSESRSDVSVMLPETR